MKLRNAAKAVLFCVIAVLLYLYLYRVFSWKDTGGDYQSAMDTFYGLDNNVVDVAFLGSSHCYCSVNTAILWEEYGMAAYSLAISGQDLASSYHCMKELLKTQKPKVVCVEMYYGNLQGYQVKGNLYRNLLGYRLSKNFVDAVDSIAEDGEKLDILLKWPIIHTRYAELTKKDFKTDPAGKAYMGWGTGFSAVNYISEIPVYDGEESLEIPKDTEEWIQKIIALAQESDVELCFFLSPLVAEEWVQKQYKYVERLAEENHIPFLNMIALQEELGLDAARDFTDNTHTNSYGAEKITEYLGAYLEGHYELADHRGERQYTLWDENLAIWKHQKRNQQIQETTDFWLYLDRVSRLEGYTAFIAAKGEYLTDDIETMADILMNMGIGESFFQRDGVWVIEDGIVLYELPREDCYFHMEVGESDVLVHGDDERAHITIDRQEYAKTQQGIDIILYDRVLEKIVDVVGFQAEGNYICIR